MNDMRFARRVALLLCVVFVAAMFSPAVAADIQDPVLARYASELSQCAGLKYYKAENTERYIDYKTARPDLDWETVVTYVNIGLDRLFYSDTAVVSDPAAVNVLVNKYRSLPSGYVPAKLEAVSPKYSAGTIRLTHDARVAFEKLCADAKKLGYTLYAISAYRSYGSQKAIYDSFYDPSDPASAAYQELRAARPGFSEHQTGLAVDVASNSALAGSAVFKWYSANAHKYGFIVRYPTAAEAILGYTNEPWHLRFLGVDLATAVYESGLTYDEYYAREIDIPDRNGAVYAVGVATADTLTVVGGTPVQLCTYNVLGTTFFRLRDIAAVLNATPLQFDITWDASSGRIALEPGTSYTGDTALAAFAPGSAVSLTAVAPELEAGERAFAPSGYAVDGATLYTLDDILSMLGAHAEDDGAGGLVIVPGTRPEVTPSPSPTQPPVPPQFLQ